MFCSYNMPKRRAHSVDKKQKMSRRSISPRAESRKKPLSSELADLLGALSIHSKKSRHVAPADSLPEDTLSASGTLGARRAVLLASMATARPIRIVETVAVVQPQPHANETEAQFRRRLRVEAAERRARGGTRKHRYMR